MESFDSRNMIAPLFLLEVTNACRQMQPGGKLEIITDDTGIAADLKRILAVCNQGVKIVERKDSTGRGLKIWHIKRPDG